MSTATQVVIREQVKVVRTCTYSSGIDIDLVLDEIRRAKSTGQISINISQGGITAVIFEEFQKLS